MSNTRDTGFLRNAIQVTNQGITFVSGSTTLMSISSSGAVTTTGVISGSNALSASFSLNSALLNGIGSVGFATTGALLEVSSSQQQISSSLLQVSASYIALSASYTTFSGSASTRITKIENNYATTGSNSFRADQSITGSLVVSSTITAQTLVVQTVTSSILYSSGSNIFGNQLANTQTFTGSVLITGSIGVNTITNASRTMQIAQASGYSSALRLIASTGGSALLEFLGDGASTQPTIGVTAAYPNDLSISTGGSTRMFISASGKVGIGTTTPTSGSLQVYNSGGTNHIALNGGSYPNTYLGSFSGGTYFANNYFYAGGHVSDNAAKRSMEFFMDQNEIDINTMPAGSPGTRTRIMTISGSQGYIGIGTTSPLEVLDVYKAHGATGWSTRILSRDENFAAFIGTYWNGTTTVPVVAGHVSALTGWNKLYVNTIDGISANSGDVVVGGFLGINITSPLTNLDINARGGVGGYTGIRLKYGTSSVQSLCMGQVTAGNGAFIGMSEYRQAGYWRTEGTAAAVLLFGSDGTFSINTNSGLTANTDYNVSARLSVTSAGLVGIGCTANTVQLDVQNSQTGTVYPVVAFRDNSTYGNALQVQVGNGEARLRAVYYSSLTAMAMTFWTGDSSGTEAERMRISGVGSVLLGAPTSVNDVRLQVAASGGAAPSWISGTFAGNGGTEKVVLGNLGGYTGASIGGHSTALNGWTQLNINPGGGAVYAGSVRLDTLSDQRVKDNIQPISGSLNKILQLNGKKFHLKDEPEDKVRYGFIAQDLEGILDEFVINSNRTFTKDDLVVENVKSIESWASSWAALLVEGIKELKLENDSLKAILQRNNII